MTFADWFTGYRSKNNRAVSIYQRGMRKAKKHDHAGAIDDYNMSIQMMDAPSGDMATVLYNRALAYAAADDERKGMDDLEAVLAMDESPLNVSTLARLKLARMESRSNSLHQKGNRS